MDSTSAQTQLKNIGVGNKVLLKGKFDFPTRNTERCQEIVSIDKNSVSIKRSLNLSGEDEIITYDKIDEISASHPDESNYPAPDLDNPNLNPVKV
ncbi:MULTISPECIES: hypothetical protein [Pseudomonas]|uniref:Uncharacterized protein n=1 Tax=Pseudomonas aphyarum TaxID=2942629 RepID=A0ABT5PNK2_9PSED|nr:hypothetical protein [Pseudomonas aphyarum]MDD0971519.1 hypothetical protein [Pseudomonas aphyarum]MDD1125329.1 hypothetical protein [Pseudomonas aphyarum]